MNHFFLFVFFFKIKVRENQTCFLFNLFNMDSIEFINKVFSKQLYLSIHLSYLCRSSFKIFAQILI